MCKDTYLVTRCGEISSVIKDAKSWAAKDAMLGAHLATYINVLIVGLMEDCIEYIVLQRAKRTKDPEVEKYIGALIKRHFRNPDYGAICSLLSQFSDAYVRQFQTNIKQTGAEAVALESIMMNKTNLAHQGIYNISIDVKDVDNYFQRIEPILGEVEQLLIP